MKKYILFFVFISIFLSVNNFGEKKQKFAELGDFQLGNSEIIQDLKIGYRTFGELNSDSSNVILFPTWFGGVSEHLANLIGENKLVDSSKYYVIAVDAIGNGVSTSPSNSAHQKNNFPNFTLEDIVKSQKTMLDSLGFKHLYGIIGGSMGGMQVFQWIVNYPNYINKAVSYTGTPKFTSYDLLYWQTRKEMIEYLQEADVPEEEIYDFVTKMTYIAIQTPEFRARETSPKEYEEFISSFKNSSKGFNSYDRKYLIGAMLAQDVSKKFNGSMEKAAEAVEAEVLIIASMRDHLVNPNPSLEFADLINAETLILYNDCGHLAPGCEMKKVIKRVQDFFNKTE